jgi:hypothetical protein
MNTPANSHALHTANRPATMRRRALAGAVLAPAALLLTRCEDRTKSATPSRPEPLGSPAALLDPPRNVPLDIEELTIEVVDGRFGHERYSVQTGPVRLKFVARGTGPHSVRIEDLMQARLLPVGQTTVVGLTTYPGEYLMMTDGGALDTAVLDVRPVGGR